MALLKNYHVIVAYVVGTTLGLVELHRRRHGALNLLQGCISFFSMLNALICLWEMTLLIYQKDIEREFTKLKELYSRGKSGEKIDRLAACKAFFMGDVSIPQALSFAHWTTVWATYSLYDPSYSQPTSFGFFIDCGNGLTMILPSILLAFSATYSIRPYALFNFLSNDRDEAKFVGIVGLCAFYQMWYGTVVYFASFFYNGRQKGKGPLEVMLFVGLSNGLWFFFPMIGMWCSWQMLYNDANLGDIYGWKVQ